MNERQAGRARTRALLLVLVLAAAVFGGYRLALFHAGARRGADEPAATQTRPIATAQHAGHDRATDEARRILYWYDPMKPEQHFDKPGKSPFMDMDLVPRYAEAESRSGAIVLDEDQARRLGVRTVKATRGQLVSSVEALGAFSFNQRDIAIVQARAAGFVTRTYGLAPGDLVKRGAPLVALMLPSWVGAQHEFLGILELDDSRLAVAARQRLHLLGMPSELIARVERTRSIEPRTTVMSPLDGVLVTLDARTGMSVGAGATLATLNGTDPIWLEVALPERQAGNVELGATLQAEVASFPGEQFTGVVDHVLPAAEATTRSVLLRASFANPNGRLRAGVSARVRLADTTAAPSILLPSAAVIRGGNRDLVMQVDEHGGYRPVQVRVGREANGQIEILDGLQTGAEVALAGQFLLDAEASLQGLAPTGTSPAERQQ